MTRLISLLFLISIPFVIHAQSDTADLYDHDHSLRFAHYLFESGQFGMAAAEFERVYFMQPSNEVAYHMLKSYRLDQQYEEVVNRSGDLYPDVEVIPGNITLEMTKSYLLLRQYHAALALLENNRNLDEGQKHLMTLNTLMLERKFDKADKYLDTNQKTLPASYIPEYRALLDKTASFKQKSPGLALALSAIVPGTGRFYTGDWKDGLFSLAIVGISSWQAYRAFTNDGVSSVYGWITAGLGFGFYLGNLYGSFQSARRVNQRSREIHYHEVEDFIYSTF